MLTGQMQAKMALHVTDRDEDCDIPFTANGPHAIFKAVILDESACA